MNTVLTLWNQPRQHWLRKLFFQIHLWLGLVLCIYIAVVCLSGSIIVFRVEMNRVTTPGTAYVKPEARRLSLDSIVTAVLKNRPGDSLHNVSMEAGPDVAWNIRTTSKEGHRIHNFVDQYRGEVVGVDDYNSKFLQWMWDLHANLLGGNTGRFVNGCLAIATLVISLTGLVIWWPGWKLLRSGFTYLFGGSWKRQNYDLHKVVGFYSFVFLFVVSFTGTYFTFPYTFEYATAALSRVTHVGKPDLCAEDGPPAKTSMQNRRVSYEDYLSIAEKQIPGTKAVFMSFPFKSGMTVGVKLREVNDWHRVGLSNVYLEPATGAVVAVDNFEENNPSTKFLKLMLPFHFGRFGEHLGFGMIGYYAVMVLYVIIGLAATLLAVTGVIMYWNRSLSKVFRRRRELGRSGRRMASPGVQVASRVLHRELNVRTPD